MQIASDARALRARAALGWLLGAAVFFYLLAFPRVLGRADESVVLYAAKRILQGQALYKDFFEFLTPGSFYLFAGLFALTGPSLLAARVTMAAANAVSCVLLFRLACAVAAPAEALVAAAVFAVACLPIWPFASPHWLSTTLCLGTAAALLSERWPAETRARPVLVGALAGLTFCVQQHRGVFLGAWVAMAIVALASLAPAEHRWGRCRRQVAWVAAGWLVVALPVLGWSVWRASLGQVIYATFTFVFGNYYRAVHGTGVSSPIAWAGVCALCGAFVPYTWRQLLWSFPAVLVVEAVALGWALRRRWGRAEILRGGLLLLAATLSVSILYYPDLIHVAFIAPFALVVAARIVHGLRSLKLWHLPGLRRVPALAFIVAAAIVGQKGWSNLSYAASRAPARLQTAMGAARGTMLDQPLLEEVRRVLDGKPSQTLLSYPADPWLYLAVPADNPTPFALMAQGYNTPEQFHSAIAALEQRPADCLVVNAGLVRAGDPLMESQKRRYRRIARVGFYEIYGRDSQP